MTDQMIRYLRSTSTLLAFTISAVLYGSYAFSHDAWMNPALIGVAVFIGIFLPSYSKLSNKIEEQVNLRYAVVTLGRMGRFVAQYVFNLGVFFAFTTGNVLPAEAIGGIGGVLGVALYTTIASQGAQYVALILFNRGYGDANRNVLIALSANILMTAAATTGLPFVQSIFVTLSIALGGMVFGLGILSDLRASFYPKGGVGIFFGTFNPFHVTHAEIVRNAAKARGLNRVIIHPTVIPKLHATALDRGEIHIAHNEHGLDVLERTPKADANVNYFPTGNKFYPPETRRIIIELAIEEAGLADLVEVMWLPETYRDRGFHGVIDAIRKAHPGAAVHGLHGSDLGGMWVRSIYDECGWIYPSPIRRRNGVSATAIRKGATGMTSNAVRTVLQHLRNATPQFQIGIHHFANNQGHLTRINQQEDAA